MRFERLEFNYFHSGTETCCRMSRFVTNHSRHDQVVIDFAQNGTASAPDGGTDKNQQERKNKEPPEEKHKLSD